MNRKHFLFAYLLIGSTLLISARMTFRMVNDFCFVSTIMHYVARLLLVNNILSHSIYK